MSKSAGEESLAFQLKALGVPFEREFTFAKPRKWRFDFVIAADHSRAKDRRPIAIEVEGGAWNGGHRRGVEFDKDCERSNAAQILGWTVLRFSPYMVETGEAIATIEAALGSRPATTTRSAS